MRSLSLSEAFVSHPAGDFSGSPCRKTQVPNVRRHRRYNLQLSIVIEGVMNPQWCYVGRTTNISPGGVLFGLEGQWRPEFKIGDPCHLEIELMPPNPPQNRVLLLGRGPIVRIVSANEAVPWIQAAVKIVSWNIVRN